MREDKQSGGGKSPMITTENTEFYGQRHESSKVCVNIADIALLCLLNFYI